MSPSVYRSLTNPQARCLSITSCNFVNPGWTVAEASSGDVNKNSRVDYAKSGWTRQKDRVRTGIVRQAGYPCVHDFFRISNILENTSNTRPIRSPRRTHATTIGICKLWMPEVILENDQQTRMSVLEGMSRRDVCKLVVFFQRRRNKHHFPEKNERR